MSIELEEAIIINDYQTCERIINDGFDLDYKTKDGYNLLTMALDFTHVEIAKLLFDKGVKFKVKNAPLTPLEAVIETEAYDIMFTMLKNGVDVNQKGTEQDQYPIHRVAWGYLEPSVFEKFIEAGANLELTNSDGETALDIMKDNLVSNPDSTEDIQKIIRLLEPKKSKLNQLYKKLFNRP